MSPLKRALRETRLTANHFIFDAISGGLVVVLVIMLAFQVENLRLGSRQPVPEAG